jgi:hypothetical protein
MTARNSRFARSTDRQSRSRAGARDRKTAAGAGTGAHDTQNRFQMVFRSFLDAFATKEHPLALFLDDLQWLDTATLDLLEDLVAHSEMRHLLLVGPVETTRSILRTRFCGRWRRPAPMPCIARRRARGPWRNWCRKLACRSSSRKLALEWGEGVYVPSKFLLRDRTGKPYALCGVATDITQLKRLGEMQVNLARERELFAQQRATELAKANEALRLQGCLDALASVPELDDFLGQVMGAITGSWVRSLLRCECVISSKIPCRWS